MTPEKYMPKIVQSLERIQEVHDVLHAFLCDDCPIALSLEDTDRDCLMATHHALCWILGHEEGAILDDVIQHLYQIAQAHGYQSRRAEEYFQGPSWSPGNVPSTPHEPR